MANKKLEFRPEDFATEYGDLLAREASEKANARLAEMLKDAQVVHWDNADDSWKSAIHPYSTHRALLINIEELPKEPCEHEPDETTGKFYGARNFVALMCIHCGKKLKAKWEVAE